MTIDTDPIAAGVWDVVLHLRKLAGQCAMIIELEMQFQRPLNEAVLRRAVDLLVEAEPILRRRLIVDAPRPEWRLDEEPNLPSLLIAGNAAEYEAFRHSGMDAASGPQVAVCLWHEGTGASLIVKVTHEMADAAGLKTIAARLASIYTRLELDGSFMPEANPPSPRGVDQVLNRVSRFAYPRLLWDLRKFGKAFEKPAASQMLQFPEGAPEPWTYVIMDIPAQRVVQLRQYGRSFGATLTDIFLAAAYRALAGDSWDGESGLRVFITVDLRRWFLPESEAGSICNLSSFEFPFLGLQLGGNYDETLQRVVHLTQERKRHYPGLASSAFLQWSRAKKPVSGPKLKSEVERVREEVNLPLFTNMGPIDQESLSFGDQKPAGAHLLPPKYDAPGLVIGMSGYDGSLTLSVGTPMSSQPTVMAFLEQISEALPG